MKICELMKNHIKNYIKIMGFAAVPFGTAQAEVVTIRVVKQELTEEKGARFVISKENEKGECLESVSILWIDKNEYPEPILKPNGCLVSFWGSSRDFFQHYGDKDRWFGNMKKWAEYYGENKFSDGFISEIASQFALAVPQVHKSDFLQGMPYDAIDKMAYDFLKSDKSGQKNIMAQSCLEVDRALCPYFRFLKESLCRKELGKHCKYVSYTCFGGFEFLLMRDADYYLESHKSRYILAIVSRDRADLCVFSDIPTIISRCSAVYSDNAVEFRSTSDNRMLSHIYKSSMFQWNEPDVVILEKRFANRSYTLPFYTCEAVRVCQGSKKTDANGNTYVEYKKDTPVFLKLRTSRECWKFLMEYNFKTPQEMLEAVIEWRKMKCEKEKKEAELKNEIIEEKKVEDKKEP